MKRALLFASALLITIACGGQKNKRPAGNDDPAGAAATTATAADSLTIYRAPRPPAMLAGEAQMQWMSEHYWDDFEFADTLAVPRWSDYAEQAFVDVNYAMARGGVPFEIASGTFTTLFSKAAANKAAFQKFAEIAEKYLFDPNYQFRNEELYISVLRAVLENPELDEWERIRPQEQLRLAMKNRVGDKAADFRYTLASGATGTLYGLRSPYTILFFNNPGCSACRDLMGQIGASGFLQDLIARGSLKVLAVYCDEDVAAWREYLPMMPENWIVSYDAAREIDNRELYDLKAIPAIYLLDGDKRVMLKDEMSVPRIEQTLYNALNPTPEQN